MRDSIVNMSKEVDTLILGAGLAGLSASYHIGHGRCMVLEAKSHAYGHVHSELVNGFTWDEGPHVSFTKSEYVRELFAESVQLKYEDYEVSTGNYYKGHWIDHPSQSNFYQVPKDLRSKCLNSFLNSRELAEHAPTPKNYKEWLHLAFGEVFADTFPSAYTRKYWTLDPSLLTTEWVGGRVFKPSVEDVVKGSKGPLARQTHYIKTVRYPTRGGYQAFATKLKDGADLRLNTAVVKIDLDRKELLCANGKAFRYERLINTIPLPTFIKLCVGVPSAVIEASQALLCSSVQLVNVTAPHPTLRSENWMYVYDEDKYSVRINCTEKLSPNNAPDGHTGVQVEVYHSRNKPLEASTSEVEARVVEELIEMGLVCPEKAGGRENIKSFSRMVPWANVVFHHDTKPALEKILHWLSTKGMSREEGDTEPLTDWANAKELSLSELNLAGRFGQWKYYWSDDCVLRGKQLNRNYSGHFEQISINSF
jgi:protoporphyrinogen oxidase